MPRVKTLTPEEAYRRQQACIKKYREENPEKIAAMRKKHYDKNAERLRAYSRGLYEKTKEHRKMVARKYYWAHRDAIKAKLDAKKIA